MGRAGRPAGSGDGVAVGGRVRLILLRRGWRQADLARALGVSRQRVSDVLRGIGVGRAARGRLAAVLGVCAAELCRPLSEAEWAELGREVAR